MFEFPPVARHVARALLLVASLAIPLRAQSTTPLSATNNVLIRGVNDPGTLTQSTIGPVVVGTTLRTEHSGSTIVGSSSNSGTAAALQSTLRASASLGSLSPTGSSWISRDVKTFSDFIKRVTVVAAPGSNLQFGDVVDVSFSIRFDGLTRVGFLPMLAPGDVLSIPLWTRLLTSADISLGYRVMDLTNVGTGGEEAGLPVEIGNFGYGARFVLDQNQVMDNFNIPGVRYTQELREGWSGFGNASGSQESTYINEYLDNQTASLPTHATLNTDVGPLVFRMQTTVGSELEIRAGLDIFLQSLGIGLTGFAMGDFLNTFDAEMYSDTPGVMILGEERGVYGVAAVPPTTVPEPGTWALMAIGLLAVGARLRNTTHRQTVS